jgi:hypothetical protein
LNFYAAFGSLSYEAWTSGTSDGIGCRNSWGWCPSGVPFASHVPWSAGEPSHPGVSYCSSMAWGQSSTPIFYDANCGDAKMVLCEVMGKLDSIWLYKNTSFLGCCGRVQTEMSFELVFKNCKIFISPETIFKQTFFQASLFDSMGKIINSMQYGTWKDTCGRRYLFSSLKVSSM